MGDKTRRVQMMESDDILGLLLLYSAFERLLFNDIAYHHQRFIRIYLFFHVILERCRNIEALTY